MEQQGIQTEGLGPKARNILLAPNPTAYSLMSLKRGELRQALRANNVPLKTVWRKKHLTLRVYAYLREKAAQAAAAQAAAQEAAMGDGGAADPAGQAGQVNQAPQPHRCMVCQDRPAALIFANCMHVGICQQCKFDLVLQHNQNHHHYPFNFHPQNRRVPCPMCRRDHKIEEIRKFFTL